MKQKAKIFQIILLGIVLIAFLFFVFINFIKPKIINKNERTHSLLAQRVIRGTIKTNDNLNHDLEYFYYIPKSDTTNKMSAIVCIPSLNGSGSTFMRRDWIKFANKYKVLLISPTFKFRMEDWNEMRSFHFPSVWSGQALKKIINKIETKLNLKINGLYFYGTGGGDQFALRYSIQNPENVKAIAVHRIGSSVTPKNYIPAKLLVTYNANQALDRKEFTYSLCKKSTELGMGVLLKQYNEKKEDISYNKWIRKETLLFFSDVLSNKFTSDTKTLMVLKKEFEKNQKTYSGQDALKRMELIAEQIRNYLHKLKSEKDTELPSVKKEIQKYEKQLNDLEKDITLIKSEFAKNEEKESENYISESQDYKSSSNEGKSGEPIYQNNVDLNGNGNIEFIQILKDKKDSDLLNFYINKDIIDTFKKCLYRGIAIVDINTEDSEKEIKIDLLNTLHKGLKENISVFYTYNNENVEHLGSISDNCKINGNGTIDVLTRKYSVIPTKVKYFLNNNNKIELIKQDFYKTEYECYALKTISLQRNLNDSASMITINKGEKVKFLSTDLEGKYLIEKSNGERGWLILDKSNSVIKNSGEDISEFFKM